METRKPRKGKGVPRETPAENSIADLQLALERHFPQQSWEGLRGRLEERGFFDAGMQQQVRIMAETATDMLETQEEKSDLVAALSASPAEKIRGVAAFIVPLVHPISVDRQLEVLCVTGALDGTWPRELSATILHNLLIKHGVEALLPRLGNWIEDSEPAVRRMVVEALRPRGVMLAHISELKLDPSSLKDLLERLLEDPSEYVRKAVANNINDVSKDNPNAVLAWAAEWMTHDASESRLWIISRGLRTLVSDGHPAALKTLGYTPASDLHVRWTETTPAEVVINQLIPFEFEVSNPSASEATVILLLLMEGPGKGKARRRSKYQIWGGRIGAGSSKSVSKRIHFVDKSRQSKLAGTYELTVTVNGQVLDRRSMVFQRGAE